MVAASVLAAPVPQALDAVTEMVPELVPATALILFVVEVPVHPDGKVHV